MELDQDDSWFPNKGTTTQSKQQLRLHCNLINSPNHSRREAVKETLLVFIRKRNGVLMEE